MLRNLAIAVLLAIVLPIHGQEKTPEPNPKQNPNETVEKKSPETVSVSVINSVGQQASQGKSDDTNNYSDSYLHHLLMPETLANIGLFVVGVIGVCVALRTLRNIERQTKSGKTAADAARDGAKAALLNAQAVINAERPWLLVDVESGKGPMGGFKIYVKNKGRTPAMITAARVGGMRVKNITYLSKEPPYGSGSLVEDLIVMPDEKPLIESISEESMNKMLDRDAHLQPWEGQTFIFGIVLYHDLADPTPDRIHETRWIVLHQGHTEEEDFDPIYRVEGIGGQKQYANYT